MCMQQNNFPNNAKVAPVLPLGKDKLNKCDMSNFGAVSVLKNFSNIYILLKSKLYQVQRNPFHLKFRPIENCIVPNKLLLLLLKAGGKNSTKIS